ncbi:hypothetical protein A2Z67_03700 [Candidatus Woesebacteria bacterium RBG_13_36_22]|uniref:Uncharacterized protein n=1 Tax=Candidatus Woesebacteria bacterium RBG_13_36_22 TaxID=1802478 RepID=A0A1F7X1C3_9BACT|nr:MAG: hypothetical protein A2Z67_03700 [Candidatus Woesebacteria bacterium RBG_13_36_22]
MDFLTMLSGYIDIGGVLLGIILTQLIRYLLPTPEGASSKFEVGRIAYRSLPFYPLFIGGLAVLIKDGLITPTMTFDEAIVKGFISGAVAAYLYKTTKVMIWGKPTTGGDGGGQS